MSTTSPPGAKADGRIPALDGLRFLAAFVVLTHHWIGQASPAWEQPTPRLFESVHPMAAYGWLGVELFFLISGFVICMTAWDRSVGEFFASRVSRLYPAYWFGVIATTLVFVAWPVMFKPLSVREVLVNLTMLQDATRVPGVEGVYWSLSVELKFYLLFALFVVWRGVTYRRAVLFCVLWGALSTWDVGIGGVNWLIGGTTAMYFIAGIAMYLMRRFGPNLLLWGIVAFAWIRALETIEAKVKDQSGWDSRPLQWSTAAIIVTLFFLVMLAVALRWDRAVRWRGLTELGKVTYPLYLIHSRFGATMIRLLHKEVSKWLLLAGLFAVVMSVAWLVERFVERPLGKLLRRKLQDALGQARHPVELAAAAPTVLVPPPDEAHAEPARAIK